MGDFVFVKSSVFEPIENNPLAIAKVQFMNRNFEGMIPTLEAALKNQNLEESYKKAYTTNLAMAYHVCGRYEEALKLYKNCDESVMKQINYYAFCHRYFKYSEITNWQYEGKISELLDHNKLNYIFNVFGADSAISFWNGKKANIYDEQILNEINVHRGIKVDISKERDLEYEYRKVTDYIDTDMQLIFSDCKMRIGIFVTDIQRHKNSAILYQLFDELSEKYEIIIYFNNIFKNKLIHSFESVCQVKDIFNMKYQEINNLFCDDGIALLIDTAEYGLRNNSISLCLLGEKRLLLSRLLVMNPFLMKSERYFPQILKEAKKKIVLVLGDLRCARDSDMNYILKNYGECKLVFESQALDEPLFMSNFYERLQNKGFNMKNIELQKGILPFVSYMQYITSANEIVLIQGASIAEISEVVQSGVKYKSLDDNDYISQCVKCECNLVRTIEEHIESIGTCHLVEVRSNNYLLFSEEGRHYCVNCTCNGDLLIFDDIVDNRYEYINFI